MPTNESETQPGGPTGEVSPERRQYVRARVRVGVECEDSEGKARVLVSDISAGGIRFETRKQFEAGQVISVAPDTATPDFERAPLQCEVVWVVPQGSSGRQVVGGKFLADEATITRSWVTYLLQCVARQPVQKERRRHFRVPAKLPARAHLEAGALEAQVVNLSWTGVGLETDELLEPGETLPIEVGPYRELEPLRLEGRVIASRPVEGETPRYLLGLEITGRTEEQDALWRQYVEQAGRDYDPSTQQAIRVAPSSTSGGPPSETPPSGLQALQHAQRTVRKKTSKGRRIPPGVLYAASGLLFILSGFLFWMLQPRAPAPIVVKAPDSLRVLDLQEKFKDGNWRVEGVVENGADKSFKLAAYSIRYTDSQNQTQSQVMVRLENLAAREARRFSSLIPNYQQGLARSVVPAEIQP